MNILMITQLYPQPDDTGDNKPTRTVEYFAKEWVKEGHKVIVIHCPSKFPLLFYLIPAPVQNRLAGATSTIFPSIKSRRKLIREEGTSFLLEAFSAAFYLFSSDRKKNSRLLPCYITFYSSYYCCNVFCNQRNRYAKGNSGI